MVDSVTTGSSSRLSQFGIYRSIDERTEEFLKLSRRRQIKHGCACAVAATVITVAVVIVILLVYEYAIIETRLVQRNEDNDSNVTNDTPVADRLDRSYFGFDQDYFEQMPLLVNAMQENGLVDIFEATSSPKLDKRGKFPKRPTGRHSHEIHSIRRTSPRPFIFEYRSPTPAPFNKKYNSRSWIEGYRNAQRMKNLETVINYLEKTINAKFGDLYSYPPTTHIAFSGVYVQPTSGENPNPSSSNAPDLMSQSSNTNQLRADNKRNHQSDPLFSFKPDSPGDVNLLADGPLKFSPVPTPSIIPMFRPIPHIKGCVGIRCGAHSLVNKLNLVQGSAEIKSSDPSLFDKPSTFSVIMNLLPMSTPPPSPAVLTTLPPYDMSRIYFTTSRPEFQFRRKSTGSIQRRRPFKLRRKRPRVMEKKIGNGVVYDNPRTSDRKDMAGPSPASSVANMILTVKVFPKAEVPQTTTDNPPSFTPSVGILNSTQVEDYHMGSSGIIPVHLEPSSSTSLPQETMTQQFFESMRTSSEEPRSWSTNPPDIFKFSQEDARVPNQYQRLRQLQDNSRQFFEDTNRRNSRDSYEIKEPPRTMIVKLNNEEGSTTTEYYTEASTNREDIDSTTAKTYVPQINGHYRNINLNSRDINNWMHESSEKRKSQLEIKTVTHRTYVPTYVEIKRIRNKSENKE